MRIARQQQGLAPDGQTAITLTGQEGDLAIVKLATGTETALPPDLDATAWTPDGSWLVMYGAGELFALNVRDGRIRSFDLGITNLRSATIGMVVG
jgi:hypothetical protein